VTFVNVKDLHDRTSEILRRAEEGKPIFVTRRGKPVAVIRGLSPEDLEDLVMLYHPSFRNDLEEAFRDLAAGRVVPLDEAIARTNREAARTANR
jgi:prevent-host-death family protein